MNCFQVISAVCEGRPLCVIKTLQVALFFNLEYPIPAKNNFCFLQDYSLGHPDSDNKTSTYLANVSDIKRHM